MQIDQDTRRVLSTLVIDGSAARITGGQLDRKLYQRVDGALGALGGAWNRKAKAHFFPDGVDVEQLVSAAIDAGKVTTLREAQQAMGWFPTPDDVADMLVAAARLRAAPVVLEPSAGEGAIVRAILRAHPDATVICVERDPGRRETLRAIGASVTVIDAVDFLDVDLRGQVVIDAAVMNPPFVRCGRGDHLDHLRHAADQVVPGGRVVSVLPSSMLFRQDRRHTATRSWIEEHGFLEELPPGSFKASGTDVNTCIARLVMP